MGSDDCLAASGRGACETGKGGRDERYRLRGVRHKHGAVVEALGTYYARATQVGSISISGPGYIVAVAGT